MKNCILGRFDSVHYIAGHQSLTSGMELKSNTLVSGNADSTVKVNKQTWIFYLQKKILNMQHKSENICISTPVGMGHHIGTVLAYTSRP